LQTRGEKIETWRYDYQVRPHSVLSYLSGVFAEERGLVRRARISAVRSRAVRWWEGS